MDCCHSTGSLPHCHDDRATASLRIPRLVRKGSDGLTDCLYFDETDTATDSLEWSNVATSELRNTISGG